VLTKMFGKHKVVNSQVSSGVV